MWITQEIPMSNMYLEQLSRTKRAARAKAVCDSHDADWYAKREPGARAWWLEVRMMRCFDRSYWYEWDELFPDRQEMLIEVFDAARKV